MGGSPGCDDGSTIDLIIFYTAAAKAAVEDAGEDIEMEIDMTVQAINEFVYANSEISTWLRLLTKFELVGYGEFGFGNACHLAFPWDGDVGDEVHPIRDALRADLVSLIIGTNGTAGFRMQENSPFFEYGGFSAVQWNDGGVALDVTLPHELGHNMGCGHSRQIDSCVGCPDCGGSCSGCIPGAFPTPSATSSRLLGRIMSPS